MLLFHIQYIVVVLLYQSNDSICETYFYQKLRFSFLNLETWLFGWFFCNVNNTCQQFYVGINVGQVVFALDSLFDAGKFEMHCLHRDLHRSRRLTTTISSFYGQSYTWLCFDPNNRLHPFLCCIF